jgi:hypothetical protein
MVIHHSPKHGVCCSIKFNANPGGQVYVPETWIKKHPEFEALFDERKHLECTPVPEETASVVLNFLRRGRLPGSLRGESGQYAVRRLFKILIIFREDSPQFPIEGLEEMVFKGILKLLEALTFLDLLQIATKEREWRLAETDDLLIRTLTIRLGEESKVVPEEALTLITDFCKTEVGAQWGLLETAIWLKVKLQRSESRCRNMLLEKYKESD